MTASPDYEAAKARLLAKSDDELLITQTADAALAQVAALTVTIAAQAAEIAALKAAAGNEDDPPVIINPPPVEEPPPVIVDPPPVLTGLTDRNGDVWAIGAGKLTKNGVVQLWSSNVVDLFLKDGDAWQKVVADWAPNGYFFHAREGDSGQPGDPRIVKDPGTLPPVVKGVQLPPGFRSFDGMTMVPGRFDQDLNPSQWMSGDTVIPYRPDLPFIKDGVLGMPCTALNDPNPGCSEVQFGEQYRYPAGEFWTVSVLDWHSNFNNAQCWTYGFLPPQNGGNTPGGRISELDHECSPLFGDAQGMHELAQGSVPPPMGPYYSWVERGGYGIDWTQPVVSGLRWKINEFAEWYLYNLGQPPRMTNRVTPAEVPVGFINEPQKACLSFRPTGWFENDADRQAKRNLKDGWTGQWDGSPGMMQVLGFKSSAI